MKLNGEDFYCPHSGVCICAATGKRRPSKECESITKRRIKSNQKRWRKLVSHDRGCACGRERSEYSSCIEPNCLKRENKMDSDDWRKVHRLAEPGTKAYGEKTMTKQEPQRYVLLRSNGYATIIDDPVTAWNDSTFNKLEDRIYRLGEEVEVKISVSVKNRGITNQ